MKRAMELSYINGINNVKYLIKYLLVKHTGIMMVLNSMIIVLLRSMVDTLMMKMNQR